MNLIKAANKPDHLGGKVYIKPCKTDFAKIALLCWDHIITYWLENSTKFDHFILDSNKKETFKESLKSYSLHFQVNIKKSGVKSATVQWFQREYLGAHINLLG